MIGCKYLVVGSGETGLYLAKQIALLGEQVILVDQDTFGGSYLHNLDIPKFWLKHEATKFATSLDIFRSFSKTHNVLIHHRQSLKKVIQTKILATYQYFLNDYSNTKNLTILQGKASFYSKNIMQLVNGQNNNEDGQLITFEHILLTIGQNTLQKPDFIKDQDVQFLHQYNVFQLLSVPNTLAIVGWTPFNLEVADIYANLGISVEIFEQKNMYEAVSNLSDQALDYLQRSLSCKNIKCNFGCEVVDITKNNKSVVIKTNNGQAIGESVCDSVFVFVKESFVDKGLNLKEVGVNYSPTGIYTDVRSRTTLRNIWAFGSCNSRIHNDNKLTQLNDFMFKLKRQNPNISIWDSVGFIRDNKGFLSNDQFELQLNLSKSLYTLGLNEDNAKDIYFPDCAVENIQKINQEGFISIIYRPSNGQIIGATIAGQMSQYRHYINCAMIHKINFFEVFRYILSS